jgi:predicted dinucleotide-binding enzyme
VETNVKPTVGIVGGTGALGSGLAKRLVKAGFRVKAVGTSHHSRSGWSVLH